MNKFVAAAILFIYVAPALTAPSDLYRNDKVCAPNFLIFASSHSASHLQDVQHFGRSATVPVDAPMVAGPGASYDSSHSGVAKRDLQ